MIVHSLADARAACRAARALGMALSIRSAPAAAGYAGPAWFHHLIMAAREDFPDLAITAALDCGDSPGDAMAALRAGVRLIRLEARRPVRAKIEAIALACGAALDRDRRRALDLFGTADPESACRAWLAPSRRAARALISGKAAPV